MARATNSQNNPSADGEGTHQSPMVSVSYDELGRLKRRARDLEAELARYGAQYGLTEEARRLFGISKS